MSLIHLDASNWNCEISARFGSVPDVYLSWEYHDLCAQHEGGAPWGVIAEYDDMSLLVSGLRSAIPSTLNYDVASCNGYSGPIISQSGVRGSDLWAEKQSFLWSEVEALARSEHIVSFFFRCHPLFNSMVSIPPNSTVRTARTTVLVTTNGLNSDYFPNSDPQHRRRVRKSLRENEVVAWDQEEDWHEFERLYSSAMNDKDADTRFMFSSRYFETLRYSLPSRLVSIRRNSDLQSAAVFLEGERYWHYHLGARSWTSSNTAMSRTFHEAITAAQNRGKAGLHLGGGNTESPDDSLLRFKKSVSNEALEFQICRWIVDTNMYKQLVENRRLRTGREASWLIEYRQPSSLSEMPVFE